MRILPMGRRAVLVDELGADPAAWALGVRRLGLAGVIDVVPAARTVLIDCVDEAAMLAARTRLDDVAAVEAVDASTASVTLEVTYDGADIVAVAGLLGVDVGELIEIHTAPTYRVAFCGFAPGFAYLAGTDPRLHMARRETPRTAVPAGSVAVAAGFTAVYPRSSPGGWHLLGTTDAVLFDPGRARPALLEPGDTVRFVAR
jgi:KipI family sensor histidine kinase inhibitor